jgi:hypothetical protein
MKDKSVQNHRTNLSLATGQICPPNLSKVIVEYKPQVSAAERRRMAAEDEAMARERSALVRRATFRVVGVLRLATEAQPNDGRRRILRRP